MIDWLIQPITAHADLARGLAPAGLLSPAEQQRLAGFAVAKRRCDWLLGRWTAKHLLQSYVARRTGAWLPLDTFVIASAPDGAPRVIADCRSQITGFPCNLQSAICNLQLSISHCNGYAFCAISDCAQLALGADIERIVPRAPEFAADYFTVRELAQLAESPANERDVMVTLIWSAKEAALKALRLGLTVDTRQVSIELAGRCGAARAWSPLAVDSTLPQAEGAAGIHGWWGVNDGYVLTIAVLRKAQSPVGGAELHRRPPQSRDVYGDDHVVAQCWQTQDLRLRTVPSSIAIAANGNVDMSMRRSNEIRCCSLPPSCRGDSCGHPLVVAHDDAAMSR